MRAWGSSPPLRVGHESMKSHLAQVFAQYPIEVAHGDGVWLHARDGRKILDFYGGHAVAGLGYGHPRWLAALAAQARQMAFQTNAVHVAVRERAAARLPKFVGLGLDTVFWINSGAEANENALKLAFKITGREKAVALEQGWHGRTAATAAVIVEPVQGVGGAYDVGKPMLQALRQRCDDVGALLIFDEVQCGTGRTGAPFAANYYGVTPDMITAAKALGNGFPVSALLMSRRVADQLKYDDMGTTFGGGPMACAVAEAVIDTIESESLLANVRQVSTYIRSNCILGPVTGTQGAGFLLGLKTSRPSKEVQAALMEKNILAGTSGDPNVLRLLPAYILNEGHVDRLCDALSAIPA